MTGAEIDIVIEDSLKALELYEKIFEVEKIEASNFPKGQNEAVFTIYGMRIHMLDENPEFQLVAPKPGDPTPVWFNIAVPNIEETYGKAMAEGCTAFQDITEIPEYGVVNAIFIDPFGYMWMLHEIRKVISHEDRVKMWEEQVRE